MRDLRGLDAEGKKTTGTLAGLGKAVAGAFAAFLTVDAAVRGIRALGSAAIEAERSNLRLAGVLRATGHAAGLSAEQVRAFAEEMQRTTLFDDEQVKDAAAAMLTFRSVQGETFREGLRLAADMASIFGGGEGSLRQSVVQLGKALEDPQRGVSALREIGVTFSIQQTEIIKQLQTENRLFEAQQLVLQGVAAQLKGTAEAMAAPDSLLGATNALSDAWGEMLERIASSERTLQPVIAVFNRLAEAMNRIAPSRDERIAQIQGQLAQMPSAPELREGGGWLGMLGRSGGGWRDLMGLGRSPAEAFRAGQAAFAARNRRDLVLELNRLMAEREAENRESLGGMAARGGFTPFGGTGGGGAGGGAARGPRIGFDLAGMVGGAGRDVPTGLPGVLGLRPEAATIGVQNIIRQASQAAIMAIEAERNRIADAISENFGAALEESIVGAFSRAFRAGSITEGIAELGRGIMRALGQMFVDIGKELISFGKILSWLRNFIFDLFGAGGPAAIVAGLGLIALGTALGAAGSGGFGGGRAGGGAGAGGFGTPPVADITRTTIPTQASGSAADLRPAFVQVGPNFGWSPELDRQVKESVNRATGRMI